MAPARSAFGASHGGRRRRTSKAGSVLAAWLGRALLTAAMVGAAHAADRTPKPVIEPAAAATQCVEPPAQMRRNHMEYLKHQRDETVRGGVRGARYSLKGCIDCHASRSTASVAAAPGNFCVSCHTYAAVKIDCFDCHTAKSPALAKGGSR